MSNEDLFLEEGSNVLLNNITQCGLQRKYTQFFILTFRQNNCPMNSMFFVSHFFIWNFWFTAQQAMSFCIAAKPPWHIAFSSQSNYDSHFFHTWYCPIIAALHSGGGIYFPQRLFGVYFICRLEWTPVDYWDQEAVKSLLRPWTTRITSVCLFNKCHQGQTILPEYRAETPSTGVHLNTPEEKEPVGFSREHVLLLRMLSEHLI